MSRHPFNKSTSDRFWRFGRTKLWHFFSNEAVDDKADAADDVPQHFISPELGDSCDQTRTPPMAQVEAVLFIAREPLSGRRLAQMAEIPEGVRVRKLLQQLNDDYDDRQCAFRIVEVAGGFQLRTRPEFASWLVRLQEVPVTVRLSSPTMETLAVIAYRQPVQRAEIERVRGVQCGELVRQLMERDLVKIVGRSEELGRPFLYGTTRNFLEIFGLGSLRDLPDYELFVRHEPENDCESDPAENE